MARILSVGIATLDIVNEVQDYPAEDEEVRALGQQLRRGGNATNTLVVLSQLGHRCDWAGVWVDEPHAGPILDELERYQIGLRYCRKPEQGKMPVSCITLSRATASRTIVHYRDLPEFDYQAFSEIPLDRFDWIHFEGRNVQDTQRMMQRVRQQRPDLPVSLEVEKPRPGIEALYPLAELVLFSPAIAEARGCSAQQLLQSVQRLAPGLSLLCTLGAQGAVGLDRSAELFSIPAFPPQQLIDTIGAGDTFNAGVIDACLRGAGLRDAAGFGCRLAGIKCGRQGLHNLPIPERGARS